jgi:hypothetical protein
MQLAIPKESWRARRGAGRPLSHYAAQSMMGLPLWRRQILLQNGIRHWGSFRNTLAPSFVEFRSGPDCVATNGIAKILTLPNEIAESLYICSALTLDFGIRIHSSPDGLSNSILNTDSF